MEIKKYYHHKLKFKDVYSRNNLPKIKDGAYVISLDEYRPVGTHWIILYFDNVKYFVNSDVKFILKEIKKFISNKNITTNIWRIQATGSTMWGHFCIGFIDFMLKNKSLLECTNYFIFLKNDIIKLKHFL